MPPRSGAVSLRRHGQPIEVAVGNMGCWLRDVFALDRPDLIVIEAYMHPKAQPSGDVIISSISFDGAIRGKAACYGIRVETVAADTHRKHFTGKGRTGDRTETNLMVLRQAIAVGYVPRDSRDWDRANACSIFDFASYHYARKTPASLTLFAGSAA